MKLISVLLVAVALSTGCQSVNDAIAPKPDVIDLVKNAVLPEHNSTTLGKALSATFKDPKWTSFETAKGQLVVEFTGTTTPKSLGLAFEAYRIPYITEERRQPCGSFYSNVNFGECIDALIIPVKFQFVMSTDRSSFSLGAIDSDAFGDVSKDRILTWIYQ